MNMAYDYGRGGCISDSISLISRTAGVMRSTPRGVAM
jgi:hypothetical protein